MESERHREGQRSRAREGETQRLRKSECSGDVIPEERTRRRWESRKKEMEKTRHKETEGERSRTGPQLPRQEPRISLTRM